jgi:hypothetical protein
VEAQHSLKDSDSKDEECHSLEDFDSENEHSELEERQHFFW